MVRIVDLAPEHERAYLACLEEYSDDVKEAGDRKGRWLARMKGAGLRVKLAFSDDGAHVGMI
jgi:hypothetical protein